MSDKAMLNNVDNIFLIQAINLTTVKMEPSQ